MPKPKCARCRTTTPLVLHHRDRNRLNDSMDNLEVLCPNCHYLEHGMGNPETLKFRAYAAKKDQLRVEKSRVGKVPIEDMNGGVHWVSEEDIREALQGADRDG